MSLSKLVTNELYTIKQNASLLDEEIGALEKLPSDTPEYQNKHQVINIKLVEILRQIQKLDREHFEVGVEEIQPEAYIETITNLFKKFHRL